MRGHETDFYVQKPKAKIPNLHIICFTIQAVCQNLAQITLSMPTCWTLYFLVGKFDPTIGAFPLATQ